jgi:uncharacterized protein YegP (UPF0339 family)
MRKFLCSLALFAAVGALVASATAPAPARQKDAKKDDKKDEKKDAKKNPKKDEVGAIEVYQANDGWRFRVTNAEGKSIAIGLQGYAKKEDCLAVIELLKTTMAKAKVTDGTKDDKK